MTQTIDHETNHVAVGKPTRRMDAEEKLTGRARFSGDLPFPGLLHARLVLSPYAHARIVSIDTTAALAIPGVVAVYTADTLKMAKAHESSRSQSPLALDEVFWCGHPVAVVLAESEALAEDGAAAVDVDYDPLPVVIDPLAALQPDAPLTRPRSKDETSEIAGGGTHADVGTAQAGEEEQENLSLNVSDRVHMHTGDIEAGWREADVVVERSYRTHSVHQSYMEPQSITVVPEQSAGHKMRVYASSQGLYNARSDISNALALPERQILVEPMPIGGAFGGKFGLVEPLAAAVAYAIRKPVRLVYTRQEELLAGNPAPQSLITVKLGAKRNGTLVALQARIILDSGAFPGAAAGLAGYLISSVYRCPNTDIRCYEVLTNKVSVGAYRAPDAPQTAFALESTVTDLCQELQIDPLEFRRQNGLRGGDPSGNPRRPVLPPLGLIECLDGIEQHPLWKERQGQKEVPEELAGWKIGFGLAVGGWPGGNDVAAAACRLESDGTISVVIGTVDLTGSDTSLALIAAEAMGLPASQVNVAHDATDTMPYSGATGGSKTIYSMGPAVLAAAQETRRQILQIASDMLEAAVDDLEFKDDNVVVKGVPGKALSLQKIAQASTSFSRRGPVYGQGRTPTPEGSPMYAAHLAKVAVDPDTGEVRVLEYVAAQDVGQAINPPAVEGQIHGGVTQGIGWALFEGLEHDENGQLLTSTLMDYALPHSFDVPNITPLLIEVPSGVGPYGAKGVGEPPVIPVAGAIANAIYDAVGVRPTELPITPERLFNTLNQ
ncbi:xanthine dehydrogenase family protein molybdopterin-binding subunit [Dictyobacter formicarum]|uniref:Xanthine dehydrogenase n=1 Tax=Dictyobacter formicarum TaxID=2778368 RepID=A0ABQ3VK27_9CHLR|nr:xanthine dehydrogenase family protein molybdopterin-binding subunit [Dictyobacter formicarum]GHO86173.1 xanthine dehydrogenase [Dictyobacter formicarum]